MLNIYLIESDCIQEFVGDCQHIILGTVTIGEKQFSRVAMLGDPDYARIKAVRGTSTASSRAVYFEQGVSYLPLNYCPECYKEGHLMPLQKNNTTGVCSHHRDRLPHRRISRSRSKK